jgi:hypothetical protein
MSEETKAKAMKWLPYIAIAVGVGILILVIMKNSLPTMGGEVMQLPQPVPFYDQYTSNFGMAATPEYPIAQAPSCVNSGACLNSSAANFDPTSTCQCFGCCKRKLYGCLDPASTQYNPYANTHDERFCTRSVLCSPQGASAPLAAEATPDVAAITTTNEKGTPL